MSHQQKLFGEGIFYRFDYDIVLLFGLTEFKAMLAWKENVGRFVLLSILFTQCRWQGVEQRSPAQIIYDPDPTNDVR